MHVANFRTIRSSATNPSQAAEGTIRKLYATNVAENAVHGSDSDQNAEIEGDFFSFKIGKGLIVSRGISFAKAQKVGKTERK